MRVFKNVAISVGPIPARVDSVKFITNRFKGGLALKTARYLGEQGHNVTVVAWKYMELPEELQALPGIIDVVRVADVFEYYDWFVAHAMDYDAFVMAAAVANLTPVHPYEGKFPSHKYKPGDEFDIRFMIAPRAIDAIKAKNPRACLIGYKLFDGSEDELVEAARLTLAESKANIVFANHPAEAKTRKLAVTADNAVIPCDFDGHLRMINRAIQQTYYRTEIEPLTTDESMDPRIREALGVVELYERTFDGYGTVAVPVRGERGMFATTSRGHKAGPVIVRYVDHATRTVHASAKATLNAPALSVLLDGHDDRIIIHRHDGDPLYILESGPKAELDYLFPGTAEESDVMRSALDRAGAGASGGAPVAFLQKHHGYLKILPIGPVDWTKYRQQFPSKYFDTPAEMQDMIARFRDSDKTLELGANVRSKAAYAYDPYVTAEGAENISMEQALSMTFDLVYARNAVNYLSEAELRKILERTDRFVANTFLEAPNVKVADDEVAVLEDGRVHHTLRLPDDRLARHWFYAHGRAAYERLGLEVRPYGRNSALVVKGF